MELRDPFSSVTHLFTSFWAIFATIFLLRITPIVRSRRIAVLVYGLSMVVLYFASGLFHGVPYTRTGNPDEFRFFQRLDQSAIFLLIAGTNTPGLVILLGGSWGRWFLRFTWGFAFVGIACLWLLPKASHTLAVAIYLGVGWFGVLPTVQYYRAIGWRAMNWVWLGALGYSTGAVCELAQWPVISEAPVRISYHEVMHLCDMAGSFAFFVFVARYVVHYQKDELIKRVPANEHRPIKGNSLNSPIRDRAPI